MFSGHLSSLTNGHYLLDQLPVNWGAFGIYSRRGWLFKDNGDSHRLYGPIWVLVTPVGIYVQVADPDAISEIFQRRTDFIRPIEMYKVLEVYGPCISTATWAEWPRHRKILATPFNEKIMSFVWDERVEQTRQLLDAWADDQIVSVAKDIVSSKGLMIEEIFGNIFAINFAGHDTTANTLCFATYLLAAHPEVQDWVSEELQSVEVTSGNYGDVFSQLICCKAALL
ncbi:cytochrome P450 [Penicillium malachiteum]|uniref:Cytochrome P450 n=1 Tax=Penicillium malachiteum TaxID=1324776 RepID=A0AAD6HQD1_9EURO|nr:cytochrome P450 [Penicillium malachiteum]